MQTTENTYVLAEIANVFKYPTPSESVFSCLFHCNHRLHDSEFAFFQITDANVISLCIHLHTHLLFHFLVLLSTVAHIMNTNTMCMYLI